MVMKLINRYPDDLIAELVITANPEFTFDFTGISISEVAENSNSAYVANTRAKLSPKAGVEPPKYREQSYIWYDRIVLGEFFRGMVPELLIDSSVKTTSDLIPLIQATYGIVIPMGTFVDAPIVRGDVYPYPHDVQMKSDAVAWTGVGTFYLRDADIDIESMVENPVLDGLYFPFFTSNRIQGLMYSYNIDCSAIRAQLSALQVGDTIGTLAADFSNVAPTPWVNNGMESENNLYAAKVLASDTTKALIEEGYPVNPKYAYAVVAKLDTLYCSNYGGVLLFQYN